jgi:hypothetical protein
VLETRNRPRTLVFIPAGLALACAAALVGAPPAAAAEPAVPAAADCAPPDAPAGLAALFAANPAPNGLPGVAPAGGFTPAALPGDLAAALAAGGTLGVTPAGSSPPACPVTKLCSGLCPNTGPLWSVTDIGPCCQMSGGTFCCGAGTIKVERHVCRAGSVVGACFVLDLQWSCG